MLSPTRVGSFELMLSPTRVGSSELLVSSPIEVSTSGLILCLLQSRSVPLGFDALSDRSLLF